MFPALLGTAAGAAAVTAGRGAFAALGNGLSFAGELAKAASSPLGSPAASAETDGGPQNALTSRIGEFTERIRRHLAAAGVKLAQPVQLISDGLGGIAVAGSHPQQAAIERAIGSDVLLERDFNRLAADYREHASGEVPATLMIALAAAA